MASHPPSWQRATKFREHLSFISTHKDNEPHNLKSAFSPTTPTSILSPSPPPSMPHLPEPIKMNTWSKSNSTATIDLERAVPVPQQSHSSRFLSRLSFWRNTSTAPHVNSPPPATPLFLPPWRALNIKKRPPPPPLDLATCKTCRHNHNHKEKEKKRSRFWLIVLIIILLYLIGNSALLNIRVLQVPTATAASNVTTSHTPTPTSAAPIPTSTAPSLDLLNCLSQFKLAGAQPSSYPCSTCTPILSSVPNDLSPTTKNPQTTGQGAALQFCALSDIAAATPNNTLQGSGWTKNTDVCSWNGVTCDSSGRITTMTLVFPGVPAQLPSSFTNLIGLQSLQITGDSNIPAGGIGSNSVLSLPSLQSIHLESTALTGPLPDNTFSSSSNLTSLTLVHNTKLGQSLPSSLFSLPLQSLIVTSQSLNTPLTAFSNSSTLPQSLRTLDLSTNSISGAVPSFSTYTSLIELRLDVNQLTSLPSSFPASLQTLSLSSNAGLIGSIPSAVCSSTTLQSCDLRNTPIGVNGANATTGSCGPCQFGSG